MTRRYLYAPAVDQLLAAEDVTWTGGTPSANLLWTLCDQQNSVRDLLSATTLTVVAAFDYNSFGKLSETVYESYSGGTTLVWHAGRPYDYLTGQYWNALRWYNPSSGSFTGEDSWQLRGGDTNFYAYCHNSPTNYTDPSGMVANWVAGGFIGGIVGAVGYSFFHTGEFTWSGFIGATTAGAVTGAIAGGTLGGSLLVGLLAADTGGMAGLATIGVTSTVVGNMAGEAAQQILAPRTGGWGAILNKDRRQEAEAGAVMGIVAGYTVPVAEAYAPAVAAWFSRGWEGTHVAALASRCAMRGKEPCQVR